MSQIITDNQITVVGIYSNAGTIQSLRNKHCKREAIQKLVHKKKGNRIRPTMNEPRKDDGGHWTMTMDARQSDDDNRGMTNDNELK